MFQDFETSYTTDRGLGIVTQYNKLLIIMIIPQKQVIITFQTTGKKLKMYLLFSIINFSESTGVSQRKIYQGTIYQHVNHTLFMVIL